jgi:hypothetical protein
MEAGPRTDEIAAARHEWEAINSALELARTEEKRAQELLDSKTSTQAEFDRSAAQARTLEHNLAAAKSRLDLLLAGTRPERIAQTKARLGEIDTHIAELRVTAPTNCVVEILGVKTRRRAPAQSRGRDAPADATPLGAGFRASTLARPHQDRRRGSAAGRRLSRTDFPRRRRTTEPRGRVHTAQTCKPWATASSRCSA